MARNGAAAAGKAETYHKSEAEIEPAQGASVSKNAIDEHAAREHSMTFRDVARKHPKIIWWSFFWCMCAVGCE